MEIARSFSQTIQVRQYEPANFFCSVKTECDGLEELISWSRKLDDFVQVEVLKSVADFQNKKADKIEREEQAVEDQAEADWQDVLLEEKQEIIKQI